MTTQNLRSKEEAEYLAEQIQDRIDSLQKEYRQQRDALLKRKEEIESQVIESKTHAHAQKLKGGAD